MARGDKSTYTTAQKRKAEHIAESYEERGVSDKEAEARAWATVNKQSGGSEKSGSGKEKSATAKRADRKDSARRAASARKGHPANRGRASAGSHGGSTSLTALTKDELMKRAAAKNVRGRSRMRKAELIKALS